MIAVDTNVLVYAHASQFPKHERALERLRKLAEGLDLWAIPVFCIGEFLRVITHSRVLVAPFSATEALEVLDRLTSSPSLRILHPGDRFLPLLGHAVRDADVSGNLVYDALIVALCREHGVARLLTEDRDFARFTGFACEHLG